MNKSANNDINTIHNNGNANNNLLHSTQNNFFAESQGENTLQSIRLRLKSFLDGNIDIANRLKKHMGMPLVERFDIYKAESLEDEVLRAFPSLYSTFHCLRLSLEKANRIIEAATEIANRPPDPHLPNNGKAHAIHYQFNQLRLHIDTNIVPICVKILEDENVINEDNLQG